MKRRNVLCVAYAFPPLAYAGTFRAIRTCRYIREHGWNPVVLTTITGSDQLLDKGLLEKVPKGVRVYRTPTVDFWRLYLRLCGRRKRRESASAGSATGGQSSAADTRGARSSLKGIARRTLGRLRDAVLEMLTIPDHNTYWVPFGVVGGIVATLIHRPAVVYSSSPPHSEHLIALILHKLFGVKWVAEFRDPILAISGYSARGVRHRVNRWLERTIIANADAVIGVSATYNDCFRSQYPSAAGKIHLVYNGFDPEQWSAAAPERNAEFTIIHAGTFYFERNPQFFFEGLSRWLEDIPRDEAGNVRCRFYGPVGEEIRALASSDVLRKAVRFHDSVPHDVIVRKMKGAGLLLLILGFDGASKGTVPSKVFEYIASGRPVMALVPDGEISSILSGHPRAYLVKEKKPELLRSMLAQAYADYRAGEGPSESELTAFAERFDGRRLVGEIARVLDAAVEG